MPYDAAGKFIMNPLAPAFVPRRQGQMIQGGQGGQPGEGGQHGMLLLSFGALYGAVSEPI